MDESNVRSYAGQQGDGTVHRVGLTRHCISSGLVQLPFALRDTFPEGDLLALDVERDEAVVLESRPPRGLAGLAEFFEAHDLQVNDRLEIRVRGHDVGEVRLTAVRSARAAKPDRDRSNPAAEPKSGSGVSPDAAPSPLEAAPAALPDTAFQDALKHDGWSTVRSSPGRPDVVETIGSVTVRRLGAGRFAAPAATTLAQPASDVDREAPTGRDARLGVSGRASRDAGLDTAVDTAVDTAAHTVADASAEPASAPSDDLGRDDPAVPPESPAAPDAEVEADAELDALLVTDDAPTPTPTHAPARPPVGPEAARASAIDGDAQQPSLFAPRDPRRPSFARRDVRRRPITAPARSRSTPGPAERPAEPRPAEPRPAERAPEPRPADASRPPEPRVRPAAIEVNVNDLADPDADATVRQRAREEELSRAGDLRSRIVRWLLAPSTPVIVPIERVQHAFDLPVEVAREVVEGVLDEPPPSLRLTRLRQDLLRVSRVTVEQDA